MPKSAEQNYQDWASKREGIGPTIAHHVADTFAKNPHLKDNIAHYGVGLATGALAVDHFSSKPKSPKPKQECEDAIDEEEEDLDKFEKFQKKSSKRESSCDLYVKKLLSCRKSEGSFADKMSSAGAIVGGIAGVGKKTNHPAHMAINGTTGALAGSALAGLAGLAVEKVSSAIHSGIGKLKAARDVDREATVDLMDWLKLNPKATHQEVDKKAAEIYMKKANSMKESFPDTGIVCHQTLGQNPVPTQTFKSNHISLSGGTHVGIGGRMVENSGATIGGSGPVGGDEASPMAKMLAEQSQYRRRR